MSATRFHPTALMGATVRWLLDLHWAGQIIRLSDAEVNVTSTDGTVHHYHGVLDTLDLEEQLDLLSDSSAASTSITVDALLPVEVARLVAEGHALGAATGELSTWIVGTTYEKRVVRLVGTVRDPEHGADDEPVSFSLEANPWDDVALYPPVGLRVDGTNWTTDMILSLATKDLGQVYPVVIGHPGRVSAAVSSTGKVTGSQGVWVDHRTTTTHSAATTSHGHSEHLTLVIAGHHVSAATVYANTPEYTTAVQFVVKNGVDKRGHPIAFIPWWGTKTTAGADDFEVDLTATYSWMSGGAYGIGHNSLDPSFGPDPLVYKPVFISWVDDADPDAGGLTGRDGALMRGAGDVLEYLLSQSAIPVDRGRFAAARPLLNGFKLDFTIDARITPWEFIQANLLPILPVTIVSGPQGLFPIVWRYDATAKDSICHLNLSTDVRIERVSPVTSDRSKVRNDFTLKYALSLRTGEHQGKVRLMAYPDDAEDADDVTAGVVSFHCRVSQERYKRPDGKPLVAEEELESLCVYDDATALAVAGWRARAFSLERRRVEYIAPMDGYGWLERGQVVTITDEDLHWSNQVALIERIRLDGSPVMRIGLLLIEEPVRDSRTAA